MLKLSDEGAVTLYDDFFLLSIFFIVVTWFF